MKRRTRRRGRRTLKWLHMITNELELIQADKLNESRLTENQEPNDEELKWKLQNSVENNRSVMNIKKEVENNLDTDSDVQNEEQKSIFPR